MVEESKEMFVAFSCSQETSLLSLSLTHAHTCIEYGLYGQPIG